MDKHNTKVKMAAKMLLDYLLTNWDTLKLMTKQTDQLPGQPQPSHEKTTLPDSVQLKGLQE